MDSVSLLEWTERMGFHDNPISLNELDKLLKRKPINDSLSYLVSNCQLEADVHRTTVNSAKHLKHNIQAAEDSIKSLEVEVTNLIRSIHATEVLIGDQRRKKRDECLKNTIVSTHLHKQKVCKRMLVDYSGRVSQSVVREGATKLIDTDKVRVPLSTDVIRATDKYTRQLQQALAGDKEGYEDITDTEFRAVTENRSGLQLLHALLDTTKAATNEILDRIETFNLECDAKDLELNTDGSSIARPTLDNVGDLLEQRRDEHLDAYFKILQMDNERSALEESLGALSSSFPERSVVLTEEQLLVMQIAGEKEALKSANKFVKMLEEKILMKRESASDLEKQASKIATFKEITKQKHGHIASLVRTNKKLLKSLDSHQRHVQAFADDSILDICDSVPHLTHALMDNIQSEFQMLRALDLQNSKTVSGLMLPEAEITKRVESLNCNKITILLQKLLQPCTSSASTHSLQKLLTMLYEADCATREVKASTDAIVNDTELLMLDSRRVIHTGKEVNSHLFESANPKLTHIGDTLKAGVTECDAARTAVNDWKDQPAQALCHWIKVDQASVTDWTARIKSLNNLLA